MTSMDLQHASVMCGEFTQNVHSHTIDLSQITVL